MKKRKIAVACAMLVLSVWVSCANPFEPTLRKPYLYFTSSRCSWCNRLESEVEIPTNRVEILNITAGGRAIDMARTYRVVQYPSLIKLEHGIEKYRITGYDRVRDNIRTLSTGKQ